MKKELQSQFGITSMGEKGQVVIPAAIRTTLKLAKGEKLVVFAKEGTVTLVPTSHFEEMAKHMSAVQDFFKSKK